MRCPVATRRCSPRPPPRPSRPSTAATRVCPRRRSRSPRLRPPSRPLPHARRRRCRSWRWSNNTPGTSATITLMPTRRTSEPVPVAPELVVRSRRSIATVWSAPPPPRRPPRPQSRAAPCPARRAKSSSPTKIVRLSSSRTSTRCPIQNSKRVSPLSFYGRESLNCVVVGHHHHHHHRQLVVVHIWTGGVVASVFPPRLIDCTTPAPLRGCSKAKNPLPTASDKCIPLPRRSRLLFACNLRRKWPIRIIYFLAINNNNNNNRKHVCHVVVLCCSSKN